VDGASIFLLIASVALALYFSWSLRRALKTRILESPQGWRTHRATHPVLFKIGVAALALLIALCFAMIITIAFDLRA
jgi:hypothetical protein